jgi:hypothetical protein
MKDQLDLFSTSERVVQAPDASLSTTKSHDAVAAVGGPTPAYEPDPVHDDFLLMFPPRRSRVRQLTEEQREKFAQYRDFPRATGKPEATYLINDTRYGYCFRHMRFCADVMTYEASYYEDFRRVRFLRLCWNAYHEEKAEARRFLRKWQVPASVLYLGEENMLYDNFCYYHYKPEDRRIQTREYSYDVVGHMQAAPMCDEAEDEIAGKGWYVRQIC